MKTLVEYSPESIIPTRRRGTAARLPDALRDPARPISALETDHDRRSREKDCNRKVVPLGVGENLAQEPLVRAMLAGSPSDAAHPMSEGLALEAMVDGGRRCKFPNMDIPFAFRAPVRRRQAGE